MVIGDVVYHFDEVFCKEMDAEQVIEKCKAQFWWPKVKIGVMDIAGSQKHAGKSHKEIWIAKAGIPIVDQYVGITDGIDRHRTFLNKKLFHSPNCHETLKEYGLYKYKDVKDENRPRTDIPVDAHNHCMKALSYGLVYNFGYVKHIRERPLFTWPFTDPTRDKAFNAATKSYIPEELR
jgi:hypothetical protein